MRCPLTPLLIASDHFFACHTGGPAARPRASGRKHALHARGMASREQEEKGQLVNLSVPNPISSLISYLLHLAFCLGDVSGERERAQSRDGDGWRSSGQYEIEKTSRCSY